MNDGTNACRTVTPVGVCSEGEIPAKIGYFSLAQ
jgi:hypothetical protein